MILNRIAQGVRKQDWFTAILELVILVIGIMDRFCCKPEYHCASDGMTQRRP